MELVDVLDSKSCVGNHVSVRPRPSANLLKDTEVSFFYAQCTLTSVLEKSSSMELIAEMLYSIAF